MFLKTALSAKKKKEQWGQHVGIMAIFVVLMSVASFTKLLWKCEGCGTRYAEYINGCPRCWIDDLGDEDNRIVFPRRKVVKVVNSNTGNTR